jgi:DNA (cytosine-5)-methyltransferase 1
MSRPFWLAFANPPEVVSHPWPTLGVMRVVSLFAGIGGIERGLARGSKVAETVHAVEWWEPARAVLQHRFPGIALDGDITAVDKLPPADLVAGGFPCTDLSQAGRTAGLDGDQSGLVLKALELIEHHDAEWLLLENVRNMLVLHKGAAMDAITSELERMGFRWAYRLVDSRFTGVPQRRQRVYLLASRTSDPRPVLFADDVGEPVLDIYREDAFGFYWTEGLRGLGWGIDCVPTLKGGSTIGIPSPPGVWLPNNEPGARIVTPGIRVAEQMQGFPKDWTIAASMLSRGKGARWRLVGNAVTVGVTEWLGRNLVTPKRWREDTSTPILAGRSWPSAGWGENGHRYAVDVSMWPVRRKYQHLADLMGSDYEPLSHRGAAGFLERLERGNLKVPDEFRMDVREHVELTR